MRRHILLSLTAAVLLTATSPARACNVPLFRYALERWRPEAYQFVILHDGPLIGVHEDVVKELQQYADRPNCGTNFTIETLDLAKVSKEDREKLGKLYELKELPFLMVRYPGTRVDHPAWQGRLSNVMVRDLIDSPARRTIAERLLKGESAVWVLLESGDKNADDAAEKQLLGHLRKLESNLDLPKLTDSPKDKLLREDLPLRIAFSALRVGRLDPTEQVLVRLLLGSEEDLADRQEPMVFPIFGRGIILHALVGKGINEETVKEAAEFLVGACRCEVKKLNPGLDLLMTADWETGAAVGVPNASFMLKCGVVDPPPHSFRALMFEKLFVIGLGAVVLVAAITLIIYLRQRRLT